MVFYSKSVTMSTTFCECSSVLWAQAHCYSFSSLKLNILRKVKDLVKLIKRVKIAHLFLVFVRLVPRYYFKIVYVILQMAVKDFF